VPMIVELKAGEVRVYNGDKIESLKVSSGIARITGDAVDILT